MYYYKCSEKYNFCRGPVQLYRLPQHNENDLLQENENIIYCAEFCLMFRMVPGYSSGRTSNGIPDIISYKHILSSKIIFNAQMFSFRFFLHLTYKAETGAFTIESKSMNVTVVKERHRYMEGCVLSPFFDIKSPA